MPDRRILNIAGANLRRIRSQRAMTQGEVADLCTRIGWRLSRATLAKIESQHRRLSDAELMLIARALAVSPKDLLAATPEQMLSIARHSPPIE